jgi:hypothetical protein
LGSGVVLQLPHDADLAALQQATHLAAGSKALPGSTKEIDLTVAGRISVRSHALKPPGVMSSPGAPPSLLQSQLSNGS